MVESLIGVIVHGVGVTHRGATALGVPVETLRSLHESLAPVRRQLTVHRVQHVGDQIGRTSPSPDADPDTGGLLESLGDTLGEAAGWVADAVGTLADLL
ncbi:MAG: hypothetical protein WB441_02730 [Nocardioidaceae bacterium]